ncbi:unnamed protein product [Arctia plantaginis]|uniref:Uncharacterized protein n=1 Tax=Arctia plantaginis TaxID=874455 RepID=A0A8S1BGQ1_ARCPL|nr:unnamed protein product [Arctia plantaginis]
MKSSYSWYNMYVTYASANSAFPFSETDVSTKYNNSGSGFQYLQSERKIILHTYGIRIRIRQTITTTVCFKANFEELNPTERLLFSRSEMPMLFPTRKEKEI